MFTTRQYRTKAAEYGELVKTATGPKQRREFQKLQLSFSERADNEQWLADNHQMTLRLPHEDRSSGPTLAEEEQRVLLCLGAALIMQWNTLPTKLQRELFDSAGTMGELLDTSALRGQVARFLHKHKNDRGNGRGMIRTETKHDDANLHAAAVARWDDEGGAAQVPDNAQRGKIENAGAACG